MRTGTAFLGGVIASTVMSVLMALARGVGLHIDLELWLGSMLTGAVDPTSWVLGFGFHLLLSGVIGLCYGIVFQYVAHRAGWGVGAVLGLFHALIAGLAIAALPWLHPLMPGPMDAPGPFLVRAGALAPLAWVVVHLAFGAVVGEIYGPVRVVRRQGLPIDGLPGR